MGLPTFGANSLLDSDTVTVSPAADASFPVSNASDDRTFTLFKWTGSAPFDVITDAGAAATSDVDYFALVIHDIFTQGGTVTFASSPDNITYTTIFTVVPADNFIIFRSFTKVTKRFFRLRITAASSPPFIGQLQWGTKVEVPFGIGTPFDPNAERVNFRGTRSQEGNILGATGSFVERMATINLPNLPSTFVTGTTLGLFKEFWDNHASLGLPFFWQWNAGDPGSFEKDAFFAVIENDTRIRRGLASQLDSGIRNIQFAVQGLREF